MYIGAGTGKLTKLLLAAGMEVKKFDFTNLEPNDNMRIVRSIKNVGAGTGIFTKCLLGAIWWLWRMTICVSTELNFYITVKSNGLPNKTYRRRLADKGVFCFGRFEKSVSESEVQELIQRGSLFWTEWEHF